MKKKLLYVCSGLLTGIVNGLLGAGGGMILVPFLEKSEMPTKNTHANSVAIILCICIFSTVLYTKNGTVTLEDCYPYVIWGVIGSLVGAVLLTKIKDIWLKRIFGVLMLWAGIRMLMK